MNYFNCKIVYLTLALLLICSLNIGITENLSKKIKCWRTIDGYDRCNTPLGAKSTEHFEMFPVKDDYCESKNLKKAYGPTMCVFENGSSNLHTNCRCVDPVTGYCNECYPDVKKKFATLVGKKKWEKALRNSDYDIN